MLFRQLFDPQTSTYTYLLADDQSREAVLIDPVREQVDRDAGLIEDLGLRLVATIETHVHADHVTGAWLLQARFGSQIIVPTTSGVQTADKFVGQSSKIRFGRHALEVRLTPGHTAGCATYVTDDARMAFTGDALLIRGSGRTDFQGGDSETLYRSVHEQIFTLPQATLLYPGHDYQGRTVTTVGEELRLNPRLGGTRTEDEFAEIMAKLNLPYPKRIDVSLPANLQSGRVGDDPKEFEAKRAWAPIERSPTGAPQVSINWVAKHRAAARMVDVRGPDEFEGPLGHIDGAELVPLPQLEQLAQRWDRTEPIVLICRSSGRSDRAALALESLGFQNVASMRGGMLAFREVAA